MRSSGEGAVIVGEAATSEQAQATADIAAASAGVELADIDGPADAWAASQAFDRVWGRNANVGAVLPGEALIALRHAGGQVTIARRADDGEVVGATVGFVGRDHDTGQLFVHSHVTGVLPEAAGGGIGRALKWYQRWWCLERGIEQVRWTYDPLVRRNAVFNLLGLGAQAVAYEQDVYGAMADAVNAGLPTDRLLAVWDLGSPRTRAAAEGRGAAPDLDGLRHAGAETWLAVGDDEEPQLTPTEASRRLVQVPPDIERLRQRDRSAATAWAEAIRGTLGHAVAAGERITGVTRDGWYVLARPAGVTELADR